MIVTTTGRAAELAAAGTTNNPFVLIDSIARNGVTSGTSTLADGSGVNALSGTTYDYWLPNVSSTTAILNIDLGADASANCAGIAAHNLHTLGASVRIRGSADGSTWTALTNLHAPTDGQPILFRFQSSTWRYWSVFITDVVAADPVQVGVVQIGAETIFSRPLYQGHGPRLTANAIDLQSNVSEGGNYMGSAVVRRGSTVDVEISRMTVGFVRANLLGFIDAFNNGKPFFWGWRPADYPADVNYCWRMGGTIAPKNTGPVDMMAVGWSARIHENG